MMVTVLLSYIWGMTACSLVGTLKTDLISVLLDMFRLLPVKGHDMETGD
jgi:hypothetical protein